MSLPLSYVIPAKAGIYFLSQIRGMMDSRFRGNDKNVGKTIECHSSACLPSTKPTLDNARGIGGGNPESTKDTKKSPQSPEYPTADFTKRTFNRRCGAARLKTGVFHRIIKAVAQVFSSRCFPFIRCEENCLWITRSKRRNQGACSSARKR